MESDVFKTRAARLGLLRGWRVGVDVPGLFVGCVSFSRPPGGIPSGGVNCVREPVRVRSRGVFSEVGGGEHEEPEGRSGFERAESGGPGEEWGAGGMRGG